MLSGTSETVRQWSAVVDLIERLMADEDLLPQAVSGVRSLIAEVSSLPVADVAGHTRALLTAATRALAARRGPTEAELAFVEELAVTRASQGIPIEVVLGAIHVAERAIWTRARELAPAEDVGASVLLDARELYDDWAEAVRSRLIRAHREARAEQAAVRRDRDVELMRRMLEGGSAASLAAAEAGLPYAGALWVLVARNGDRQAAELMRRLRSDRAASLTAPFADTLVTVTASGPTSRPRSGPAGDAVVGIAGPVGIEEIATAHRLAASAVPAAESVGRTGAVHVGEVASVVAVLNRTDLSASLVARHEDARRELGPSAVPVAQAVRAWLEADRDTARAASALFVHANTVRNRVQRFTRTTGIDPLTTFGALDAWWLCVCWLAEE